jgi:methylthioribose-1-phosphate isomerase
MALSRTIRWQDDHPVVLDQTLLPFEAADRHCLTVEMMAEAIAELRVRGAPAIGVAAAYGVALAARLAADQNPDRLAVSVESACQTLAATRPTAVNLFWAIERMRGRWACCAGDAPEQAATALLAEAHAIAAEDEAACLAMGTWGAPLIGEGAGVLTHCNAGALATAGIGTATAPIFTAHAQGRRLHVYVDETRPLLQGARLTAWECRQAGVPFTLITDGMAASIMRRGLIDVVFVGADRIAANGDVANKIGTYGVALAAAAHGIPFYVVAPVSTLDLGTPTGDAIPIEERGPEEVRAIRGCRLVPEDFPVTNPAFDVTPARFIAGIISEHGIVRPPYPAALAGLNITGMAARQTQAEAESGAALPRARRST